MTPSALQLSILHHLFLSVSLALGFEDREQNTGFALLSLSALLLPLLMLPPPPLLPPLLHLSLPLFLSPSLSFSLSLPLFALVVRHVRGIPGHSCHVKECSQTTEDGSLFFLFIYLYLFIYFLPPTPHSKHLNMHHPLLTLNHEVGSEMNLALRSHARTYAHTSSHLSLSLSFYICVRKKKRKEEKKLERSGTACRHA